MFLEPPERPRLPVRRHRPVPLRAQLLRRLVVGRAPPVPHLELVAERPGGRHGRFVLRRLPERVPGLPLGPRGGGVGGGVRAVGKVVPDIGADVDVGEVLDLRRVVGGVERCAEHVVHVYTASDQQRHNTLPGDATRQQHTYRCPRRGPCGGTRTSPPPRYLPKSPPSRPQLRPPPGRRRRRPPRHPPRCRPRQPRPRPAVGPRDASGSGPRTPCRRGPHRWGPGVAPGRSPFSCRLRSGSAPPPSRRHGRKVVPTAR
mmetsp:Transcript_39270/g.76679  ORF Transcript_39270/g.76679 Transcript_39270/m.76679 type:complete len:258 (+) Transcript_39270:1395-2168(+)